MAQRPRILLRPQVDLPGLEGLELHRALAEIIEAYRLEIEAPAIYGEILAPIVGIALVDDGASRVDLGNAIGPRADGGCNVVASNVAASIACLGNTGISARISGISRSPLASKVNAHRRCRQPLGLRHLGEIRAVIGPAFLLQDLQGEQHILRRNRRPVGEVRLGIEVEGYRRTILRHLHALSDQSVERERLIERARHQALVDEVADARNGLALDDQRIETVEGAKARHRQAPSFGRCRIDVGEVMKARSQRRCAVHGNAVQRLGRRAASAQREQQRATDGRSHRRRFPKFLVQWPIPEIQPDLPRHYHMLAQRRFRQRQHPALRLCHVGAR